MKSYLILILAISTNLSFSQTRISQMNECEFFDYLRKLKVNNYENREFESVKADFSKRSELLVKLETYFTVIGDTMIFPLYVDVPNDKRACTTLVKKYIKVIDSLEKQHANARQSAETRQTTADSLKKPSDKHRQIAMEMVRKSDSAFIYFLLLELTDLNKMENGNSQLYLAEFKQAYTLELLYYLIKDEYYAENADYGINKIPNLQKEQNLQYLARRMDILDHKKLVFYESFSSKPDFFKGLEIQHDNDVFLFIPGMNQDRELTGGFKFTLATDYFKMRWFRPNKKREDNVLTYQTLSLLGSGYTPYIRYRNNFALADSLHQYDRPFSSFFCFEMAKNRTWRTGLVRQKGEFQFGSLGISQGRRIQAKLHEDVIHSSQYVYGWDKQIANNGRLVLQMNQKFDFLLWSNTNRYKSIFRYANYLVDEPSRKIKATEKKHNENVNVVKSVTRYKGLNYIFETEARLGTVMTTAGCGIRFSTLDLLKQSGNNMITYNPNTRDDFGWKFDIGFNYRYVIHNSLLEGLGLFRTFDEDPYDVESLDYYALSKDRIMRNMFILDLGISVRFRKMTVYYRQTWNTLEYKSALGSINFQDTSFTNHVDAKDVDFYNDTVIKEQQKFLNHKIFGRQFYGFGTIGVSWMIDYK
ncbi:MAG: DUF2219 family protein [Bacteroidetes bacterium]|nr:DUF2219 family protein [Bacteroidota bacterium]